MGPAGCSGGHRWRPHLDDIHHPMVLVLGYVAVKHETADVRAAEVDAQLDAGVWVVRVLVPERNLDHVQVLAGDGRYAVRPVDLEVVLRFHQRSEERRVGKEGRSRWSPDH